MAQALTDRSGLDLLCHDSTSAPNELLQAIDPFGHAVMSASIEDYALIGDGRTAALIARDGSLDWLCWPRFDSEACFAKLLGSAEHGRWSITPSEPQARTSRRYLLDTLILETSFETSSGAARLVDFMPMKAPASSVVRLVIGVRGDIAMRMNFAPRFNYGALAPRIEPYLDGVLAKAGPHVLVLRAPSALRIDPRRGSAEFTIRDGQRLAFVLSYGTANAALVSALDAERALSETSDYWLQWIQRFDRPTDWPQAVRRSLLTLRALTHLPSGALVAAPTTSLPERLGGSLNWDYRFSWLRDSTFTLTALLNAGYHEKAAAWRDWLLRAIAAGPDKMSTVYRVDGTRELHEHELSWLPGFADSRPVRIGNVAAYQHQGDIYGEVIDAMELATRAGIPQTSLGRQVESGIVEYLKNVWNRPGQGLWESRGKPRHFTYSRVMAWVGVDRFLRSAARFGHADEAQCRPLRALKKLIYEDVCRHGYDATLGRFVQHYGGTELDASLLLLPLVGFVTVDDPRMANTIKAVEHELMHEGLVIREGPRPDGTHAAFLACSCWLSDCRRMQGRVSEARELLERVFSVRNDVGLLSEQYSLTDRQLCGNFPQALSHLAVVNSALGLSGPVWQRGGG